MVLVASCAQCPVIRRRTALRLRGRGPATSAAPGACPGVRDHLPGMQRAPIDATRTRPLAPAHPRNAPPPQEPPCFPLVLDPSSGRHVGPPCHPQPAGRFQRCLHSVANGSLISHARRERPSMPRARAHSRRPNPERSTAARNRRASLSSWTLLPAATWDLLPVRSLPAESKGCLHGVR